MGKKRMIQFASATVLAASTIVAVAPVPTDAATTSLNSQIKAAKATIKKPFDTYFYSSKLASISKVKKQVKAAKDAKKDITATIKKSTLPKKQKEEKLNEIKAYDKYITRAEGYVKGYQAAEKANLAHKKALKSIENSVIAQKHTEVKKRYNALHSAVEKTDKAIKDTVYGAKIEALLYDKFTKGTKKALNGDLKVPYFYDKAEYWIDRGDLKTAAKRMETVSTQLKKVNKTSKLGKAIHVYVKEVTGKYAYAEKLKAVEKQVSAYEKLASGPLKMKAQIDAANKAKAAIDLKGINKADTKAFQARIAAADKKLVAAEGEYKFSLSLMHTNDTHAHLDSVAKRVTAVKEVRESKPQALLIDARSEERRVGKECPV